MMRLRGTAVVGCAALYGAKQMVHRFGIKRLTDAVAKVQYRGLDLSHLYVTKTIDWLPLRACAGPPKGAQERNEGGLT